MANAEDLRDRAGDYYCLAGNARTPWGADAYRGAARRLLKAAEYLDAGEISAANHEISEANETVGLTVLLDRS